MTSRGILPAVPGVSKTQNFGSNARAYSQARSRANFTITLPRSRLEEKCRKTVLSKASNECSPKQKVRVVGKCPKRVRISKVSVEWCARLRCLEKHEPPVTDTEFLKEISSARDMLNKFFLRD